MPAENKDGSCYGDNAGTAMDDSVLDAGTDENDCRVSIDSSTRCSEPSILRGASSSQTEDEADGMCLVRRRYEKQGISDKAIGIILKSWRVGTQSQYKSYIKQWILFCRQRKIDPSVYNEKEVVEFLVELHERDLSYSAINTARSALSTFLIKDGTTIGKSPLVVRFMKGIFEIKPVVKKFFVWDVKIVLDYLELISPIENFSLTEITMKLVMLLALVSAQRAQTLSLLNIDNMLRSGNDILFHLDKHVKQTRAAIKSPIIRLYPYCENKNLCVITTLEHYLLKTESLRGNERKLFISLQKPHSGVGVETISRWLKSVLYESGIDTSQFKSHSTRSASTTCALSNNVVLDDILNAAGWKNANTFGKYYQKIVITDSFSSGVLSGYHHTQ